MAYDYKKEFKELYRPGKKPTILEIPAMKFIAVRGSGDPNQEEGEYKTAIGKLYAVAYTIKMSKMGSHTIPDYFDFVVPPLEGFWWQQEEERFDFQNKDAFEWISLIRIPDFVTREVFDWAISEAQKKKEIDLSEVELLEFEEGLVGQCMHVGSYDNEAETIEKIEHFIDQEGYEYDRSPDRFHHEIYLSDPRRAKPENLKTIIRLPIKNK